METNTKEIGLRITQARKAVGLKKVELANKIQVAASTIGRYEDGTILKVSIPVIYTIAMALSVNPMWIIGKSEYIKTEEMLATMNESNLSEAETAIIKKYKGLNEKGKEYINEQFDFALSQVKYKAKTEEAPPETSAI